MTDQGPALDAGAFSDWLSAIQGAIRGLHAAEVPCDGCTACCRSSQFVHIEPDETDTLAHVPPELLFPAPGRPEGHVLIGHDERGHCPMLGDGGCSIYEHRPRTCRTYDCRVFSATGVMADEADVIGEADVHGDGGKAAIARQARRWRFRHPTADDRARHDAVRAAADFLRAHPEVLPEHAAPATATQLAVLALELHDAFLRHDEATGQPTVTVTDPEPTQVRVEIARRRAS